MGPRPFKTAPPSPRTGHVRTCLAVDIGGANLKWALAVRPAGTGPSPFRRAPRRRERSTDQVPDVTRCEGAGGPADGGGRLRGSGVLPFPLWEDPDNLARKLEQVGSRAVRALGTADPLPTENRGDASALPPDHRHRRQRTTAPDLVALSLSGELADCFPSREVGVRHIVSAADELWRNGDLRILCRDRKWRTPPDLRADPLQAAAANWLAPAEWLVRTGYEVLLGDMGSTTTDLVPVADDRIGSGATTDLERLRAGELVYTGLLRTPLSALLDTVAIRGAAIPVAAERFALVADAHLWLGRLEPGEYRCIPPDGGPRTREAAGRRLARMMCSDPRELGSEGITAVARAAAEAQSSRIIAALRRQRRSTSWFPEEAIPTGSGARILAPIMRREGLTLADVPDPLAGSHAAASTATTLALLALDDVS